MPAPVLDGCSGTQTSGSCAPHDAGASGEQGTAGEVVPFVSLPQGELVLLGCKGALCNVLALMEATNRMLNCNVVCFEIAHTLI